MRPSSLAVIGLGAIGGSLAWQARLAGIGRVVYLDEQGQAKTVNVKVVDRGKILSYASQGV